MAKVKITATSVEEFKEIESRLQEVPEATRKNVVRAKKGLAGIIFEIDHCNMMDILISKDNELKSDDNELIAVSIRNQEVTVNTERFIIVRPMRETTTDHLDIHFSKS